MKKIFKRMRGFTLIELIVSISLLALIGISVGIYLNRISGKTEENEYDVYVNKIKSAVSVYVSKKNDIINELESNKAFTIISVDDLQNEGLLANDIKDPSGANKKYIKISLDENGSFVIEYPYVKKDEYVVAKDIKISLNSTDVINPYDGINDKSLYHVNEYGAILKDLVSGDNIICLTNVNDINTSKMGTYKLIYKFISTNGKTISVNRNVLVVDSNPPILSDITINPSTWTNQSVKYSAKAMDAESGLKKYCFSKVESGFCSPNKKIKVLAGKELEINGTAEDNGTYSVVVIDEYDNRAEKSVMISNIDKTKPIINASLDINGISESNNINIHLKDCDNSSCSGLAGYAVTTSTSKPTNWVSLNGEFITDVSYPINSSKTYYVWGKDAAGNVSDYVKVIADKIAVRRSHTFSDSGLSSDYVNTSWQANNLLEIINVSNYSFSASKSGNFIVISGSADFDKNVTCYVDKLALSEYPGTTGGPCKCSYGGRLNSDNTKCIALSESTIRYASLPDRTTMFRVDSGSSFVVEGYCSCTVENGINKQTSPCSNTECVFDHYNRTKTSYYSGDYNNGDAGCKGRQKDVPTGNPYADMRVWGQCNWAGDYNPSNCPTASCPAGYHYNSSYNKCFKCNSGTLSGNTCKNVVSSCVSYKYSVIVNYWERV